MVRPPVASVESVLREPYRMGEEQSGDPVAKRILIVEDNELNMKLLNDILEAHGYDIIKSSQGEEAIALARNQLPDIILLDIQLPDISGLEVSRRLKADPDTSVIPIIAVTAFAMGGDEKRALDAGCDGYVTKPIMLREFLDLLQQFGPAPRLPY